MVCCCATKNRLETRVDRPYTTPSHTACQQCTKSRLRTPTKKHPSGEGGAQLFPWKNHLSPKNDPRNTCWRDPLQVSEAQESIQLRTIAEATSAHHLGSHHRTTPRSSRLPTWTTPSPHPKRNR